MLKKLTWQNFYHNIQQDLKLYICTWLYLNLLRIISIVAMRQYEGKIDGEDILFSLFYGAKMSLKTAGILMLFSFILVSLPKFILGKQNRKYTAKLVLSYIFLYISNFLFVAKFFYYKEFHSNFNEMVFNAVNDDMIALLGTFVEQYHLIPFTIGIALVTALLIYIERIILTKSWLNKNFAFTKSKLYRFGFIIFMIFFALFVRFGGSFSYAHSIHWENCAKTQDTFLNEMILDDMQAIYRGYSIKKRIDNGIIYGVDKANIANYVAQMAKYSDAEKLHREDLTQIDANLYYEAQGNKIPKPKHIFIIIGESFAQWPLLDEYANLGLGEHMRAIMAKDNSTYTHNFMPNGAFTPMAVNAIV